MSVYTIVDEGYDVEVRKTFDALWKYVSGCHRRTESDETLYLDQYETVPLTKSALRKELKTGKTAWIYEAGQNDWTIKIQIH